MTHENLIHKLSGSICSTCGGEAPDWICPKCGTTSRVFDPLHRTVCKSGGKMQAQCKRCGKAEEACVCTSAF